MVGTVAVQNVEGVGAVGQERRWRYYVFHAGGFRTLVTNERVLGGLTDIVQVGRVALNGSYAAYTSTDQLGGGRYGTQLGVVVTNLLTGRMAQAQPFGDEFSHVLLAPPIAAWTSNSSVINASFVQAFNGRTGKTTLLDSTCPAAGQCSVQAVGPAPFGSLQLLRCVTGCAPIGSTSA